MTAQIGSLSSIITYVRRIIKSPSSAQITDNLIIDYINRFYLMDMDARMQLFDLKTKYQFQTIPGVDQYNMPLYSVQSETPGSPASPDVSLYPIYQGFLNPCYINGFEATFQTQEGSFYNLYPNVVQNFTGVETGDGTTTNFNLTFPIAPSNSTPVNPPVQAILRGHVDISGIIATGSNVDPIFGSTLATSTINPGTFSVPSTSIYPAVYITSTDVNNNTMIIQDSGQFFNDGANKPNYGLLMSPGTAPFGYSTLTGGYSTTLNTVNYLTGTANVTFPTPPASGADINVQCYFFQTGLPRQILFKNNTIILRSPPDTNYLVELTAYLTPAAFFNSAQSLPFAYMSEYIARGAARKILADTGDWEQFDRYESLFREQEMLVWKRSQRQFTATRTPTIYSQGFNYGQSGYNIGGNTI